MCNQTEDIFRKWTEHAMAKRKDKQWPTLRYTENTNPIKKKAGNNTPMCSGISSG